MGEEEEGLEDLVQLALAEGKEVRFLRTISIYSGTLNTPLKRGHISNKEALYLPQEQLLHAVQSNP